MKGVCVVKVDGGFLLFPREMIVLQDDVAGGRFVTGIYEKEAWEDVAEMSNVVDPETPPPPAPEVKDGIPF